MNLNYMTPKEAAERWGVSQRRVHKLCLEGRIRGVERHGWTWLIPATADKPRDARIKSGRYIKTKQDVAIEPALPDVTSVAQTVSLIHQAFDQLIHRPRLIKKIAPPGCRLTYIHANAGYGKTTLLMQYAKGRTDLVWLALDDRDSDLLYFLHHLEASLRVQLGELKFHTTDYIPFVGSKTFIPTVLSALLRAIGHHPLTIILDDLHTLTNDISKELLIEWAKNCPPHLTLIMASRHELWSGLLRLKMAGKVAELTKDDLCFSREEAEELWGFFDPDAYSSTEGWALAIQSYQIAAQHKKTPSMSKLSTEQELFRYLKDEIFMKLPSEFQHFLMATSWLTDLDAETCNSLLAICNAQEILDKLIHQHIFTERVSASSYRYHTLFRQFLQANDDGRGRETLHMAMMRCFNNREYEQSADYALQLGQVSVIQDCLSAIIARPSIQSRHWSAKKYFDYLDAQQVELSPRVQLAKGIYLSERGEFYQADKYLSAAMSQLDSADANLYLQAMTHKARVLRNKVSFEASSRCIDSLVPLLKGLPMQDWYGIIIEKIHNLTLTSQLSAALELTLNMMEKCSEAGAMDVRAWFERYLTAIYFHVGDYRNCLKAYEKSLAIPQPDQEWLMRHCVGAYAAKAYQISGQEEKALPLLEAELERMRQLGLHEEFSVNYLLYAEITHTTESLKFYQGQPVDYSVSDHYLDLAEEYAVLNRSTRDHSVFVKIWRYCAALLKQPEKTEQYVAEILHLVEKTTPFFQSLAYGRMANALQVLEHDKRQYVDYYERSIEIGERAGSVAYATIAYGRLATIYLQDGDEDKAREYARRFLEYSCQNDHRYYLRFKPLFAQVLKRALEWGITPEFTRDILTYGGYTTERVYINTMGCFYAAPAHDRGNPVKIRTQKARELLAYLLEHRQGVSRERICADLWEGSEANVTSLFHTRRGEIRRAFESMGASNPILHDKGLYRLNMDEIICDQDLFWQSAADYRQIPTPENAQRVVELYTGHYLGDMEALWAESARLRCEDIFLEAAETLLESYKALGQRAKRMELLRRCTSLSHHGYRYDITREQKKK